MHLDTKMEQSTMGILWSATILHILLKTPLMRKISTHRTALSGCLIF